MKFLWVLLGFSGLVTAQLASIVFVSERTPANLSRDLFKAALSSSIDVALFTRGCTRDLHLQHLVFDFTFSELASLALRRSASQNQFVLISQRPGQSSPSPWEFYLHPASTFEAEAMKAMVEFLDWNSFHLLATTESVSATTGFHTTMQHSATYTIMGTEPYTNILNSYAAKTVKYSGNWKSVVFSEHAGHFVDSLEHSRIYKEGCGVLVSPAGVWGRYKQGVLAIIEPGLEETSSKAEYEAKAVASVVGLMTAQLETVYPSAIDTSAVRKILEEATSNRTVFSDYLVINYDSPTEYRVVGSFIAGELNIDGDIVFPGNVRTIPDKLPTITVSANLYPFNYDGSFSLSGYQTTLGLLPMIHLINQDPDLIENFEVNLHGTDCGHEIYKEAYFEECFAKHLGLFGVFYIDTANDLVAMGNIKSMEGLGVTIPHTGILNQDYRLHDKQAYPQMIIPFPRRLYLASIIPPILAIFGWNRVILLLNNHTDQAIYEAFLASATRYRIEIVNEPEYRFVAYKYSQEEFDEVNSHLYKYLYDTKAVVYVSLLDTPTDLLLMTGMFNYGLKRGEAMFILGYLPSYTMPILTSEGQDAVRQLADGALVLTVGEYFGDYGQALKEQMKAMIAPEPVEYTCYGTDALKLGLMGVDLLLRLGKDYEDPELLNEFIRQQRFTGCSGAISIESTSNGRSDLSYQLYNTVCEDACVETLVGYYQIGVSVPLVISDELHWPGNSDEPPGEFRQEPECGFSKVEAYPNLASAEFSQSLVAVVAAFVLVPALAFFRQVRYRTVPMLSSKRPVFFEDGIAMLLAVGEVLQFGLLSLNYVELLSLFHWMSATARLNVELTIDSDQYWPLMQTILSLGTVWMGVVFWCGVKISPLVSQGCFAIVLLPTLTLFDCRQGIGDSLTDSFLTYDCHMFCWQETHVALITFVSLFFIGFALTAIVFRPLSDSLMDYINVNIIPLYSVFKSVLELIMILQYFYLRQSHSMLYALANFAASSLWLCGTLKLTPYNYDRLNMWLRLCLIGLLVNAGLVLVSEFFALATWHILVVDCGVGVLLAIGGFVRQAKKYPSYFTRPAGRSIEKLLQFSVGRLTEFPEEPPVEDN